MQGNDLDTPTPDTELKMLAETGSGEEYLQVDRVPALEVSNPSHEISSSEES